MVVIYEELPASTTLMPTNGTGYSEPPSRSPLDVGSSRTLGVPLTSNRPSWTRPLSQQPTHGRAMLSGGLKPTLTGTRCSNERAIALLQLCCLRGSSPSPRLRRTNGSRIG